MESPILLFILAGVIIVVAIILQHMANERRRRELMAWCLQHSLSFASDRREDFEGRFPGFECLRKGDDRYADNVMSGDWNGYELTAFDYHYETHSTDSEGRSQTEEHAFSAVVLASKIPLKPLLIRPEDFGDKFKAFFGFEDINFESSEFSRTFFVKAADKRWAYDVIHPRMMEFLLAAPRFWVQMTPSQVMAYREEKIFKTEDLEAAARLIQGLLDGLPEYLREQQASL